MTISTKPAILHITTSGKNFSRVNYSRRMYAIIRRYTPNVAEGDTNEYFADLTGLRTFFKMSYKEIAEKILSDLNKENQQVNQIKNVSSLCNKRNNTKIT